LGNNRIRQVAPMCTLIQYTKSASTEELIRPKVWKWSGTYYWYSGYRNFTTPPATAWLRVERGARGCTRTRVNTILTYFIYTHAVAARR